jgi:hypothetical protein
MRIRRPFVRRAHPRNPGTRHLPFFLDRQGDMIAPFAEAFDRI